VAPGTVEAESCSDAPAHIGPPFDAEGADGVATTVRIPVPVACWPSGFLTVTSLAPAVAAVVSTQRLICVTGVVAGEAGTMMLVAGHGRPITPPVTVAEM